MNKVTYIIKNPLYILAFLSVFGLYWQFFQFNYSQPNSIAGDGVGYYQYLPNTFLTNSLENQVPDGRFIQEIDDKGVNKYYIGTAVSMAPFFGLGHLIAQFSEESSQGFSWQYHWAISLAALFYLMLGVYFFICLLRLFEFSDSVISISILCLVFGTNLFAYSFSMPSMSHVYSFCWISGFLFFSKSFFTAFKRVHLLWAAFFLGMIILIRPINGIIIFALPFLANSFSSFSNIIASHFTLKRVVISGFIILSILFIQSIFWHAQSGKWLVWSYGNEGFNFTNPQWVEFLFGFRKGALIYTPVLLFSVAGLGILIKKNLYQGLGIGCFFFLLIYVLSSWWNWYYGPSFSQRPLVEFYGVSFLLVAFFLKEVQNKVAIYVVVVMAVFCVFLNLIQTYQYQKSIISSWDMTQEKYRYSFLKTGNEYQNKLGGNNDILPFEPIIDSVFNLDVNSRKELKGLELGSVIFDKDKRLINYKDAEFNFALTVPLNSDFVTERGIYIQAELEIMDFEISNQNEALFVVELFDSLGNGYQYSSFPIRSIPPTYKEVWKKEKYSIEIQQVNHETDVLKVYIWNKGKENFWVRDLQLTLLSIEKK